MKKKLSALSAEKVIQLYLFILFGINPLFLVRAEQIVLPVKVLFIGLLTTGTVCILIYKFYEKKVLVRQRFYKLDICIISILPISVIYILICIFQGRSDYDTYLLGCILVFLYFILSYFLTGTKSLFDIKYLEWLVKATVIIYIVILLHLIFEEMFFWPIALLLEDKETMSSFLVLSLTVCILLYCFNRRADKERLYIITAITGFFILFIQKEIISILLVFILFIIIPIFSLATVELVKRDLTMAFIFFVLLSNMFFLSNILNRIGIEVNYNAKSSIYADIIIVLAGVLILSYWDKIPKNISYELIIMKGFCKKVQFSLKILFIILLVILCNKSLIEVNGKIGQGMLHYITKILDDGVSKLEGTFGQILIRYGITGLILISAIFVLIIDQLKKRSVSIRKSSILTVITIMYLLQSFFYKQQAVTSPIYVALVTLALFDRKGKDINNVELEENKNGDTGNSNVDNMDECSVCKSDGTAGRFE